MYLIAGLGNPEKKYLNTRHNTGFMALDELIDRNDIPAGGSSKAAMYGKGMIEGEKVILIKPLTYMNLSGTALRNYTEYYKIDIAEKLIVIYDDVDLPVGTLRIRKAGSAGSHNGMKSIISSLGTESFTRVRIGIGPKPEFADLADFVLSPFYGDERKTIDKVCVDAALAVETIIRDGVDTAMNKFNCQSQDP